MSTAYGNARAYVLTKRYLLIALADLKNVGIIVGIGKNSWVQSKHDSTLNFTFFHKGLNFSPLQALLNNLFTWTLQK